MRRILLLLALPAYGQPAGEGEAFYYNRPDGVDPLGVGMVNDQPMAVDWDRDGRTDLLQRNIYASEFGQPPWGLFFWRNIGGNGHPRFAKYIRIIVDEQPLAAP